MDLSPETWVDILVFVAMVGGGIVWWRMSPRKKKKLHIMDTARKRPRE